ncbi:Hypothetical predicted protein [Mytilus galloprovincialis]|uniref:Uncharacterized protein n=1 Tax=Mytilus galloprovincialis TaxID=29158 RepID=A0A8B6C3G4_MYTGA|nr:Hypothetical predicted protein [Mytilus galloprovincialis]
MEASSTFSAIYAHPDEQESPTSGSNGDKALAYNADSNTMKGAKIRITCKCEDIYGHPDEQKSLTSWYAMPLCGSTPRSTTGWSQSQNQSQLPPFELPIRYHLEHFEAVVPRVRLFSVMVPKPAIIQIPDGD